MNICLYVPTIEDYWYEEKVESDSLSMSYNAGYDVFYFGYHYDTGCIDFPKERWQNTFDRRIQEKRYFAYIKDLDLDTYVGYVNYQLNAEENRYECGVLVESTYRGKGYGKEALLLLCEEARKNGIHELYDNFEKDRDHTLELFESVGFEVVEEKAWKKFHQDVDGVIVRIML